MESIKIFTKSNCPKCLSIKKVADELKAEEVRIFHYDLDTPEGLAEASFYSILSTPSLIIENGAEEEIASWRGVVPSAEDVKKILLKIRQC